MLTEKDYVSGQFKWVEKFVKYLRYYGLDGVGINPEGTINAGQSLQDFFTACREYAESIGWQFQQPLRALCAEAVENSGNKSFVS